VNFSQSESDFPAIEPLEFRPTVKPSQALFGRQFLNMPCVVILVGEKSDRTNS
jgi:hypothetical protein